MASHKAKATLSNAASSAGHCVNSTLGLKRCRLLKTNLISKTNGALPGLSSYPRSYFNNSGRIHGTIRLASTSAIALESTSGSGSESNVVPEAGPAFGSSSDWAVPFDHLSQASTEITPYVGYLKELGLDFGWGPTSLVQWSLESLQVGFGLPVWGAALGVTLAVRFLVLPLAFEASDGAARMKALGPKITPLRTKMMEAAQANDRATQMAIGQEMKSLYKAANIKPSKMFYPILVQAPLGFGLFRLTRSMADLPVPGLDVAGFSWLYNLAVPDPYYVLPAATAGLMWITMKRGANDQGPTSAGMTSARAFMINGFPIITLAVTAYMPALTQIGFIMASAFQFVQGEALRSEAVRQKLKLHPMVTTTQTTGEKTYKGTLTTEESLLAADDSTNKSGALSRFMGAPSNALKSMKSSANSLMEKAKSADKKSHGRLSSSELKSAKNYEASRRKDEDAADKKRRERERHERLKKLQR